MSPTRSSAGGLKLRTRATRFDGSSSRTPGVAANTRPFRSYVPSPGSNSSATAISSPGRTIFRSISIRSTAWVRTKDEPSYLSLRHGDSEEDDVHSSQLLPMEVERMRDRKRICEAIRDRPAGRLDVAADEGFGGPIEEHVNDATASQRRVQERPVGVPALRSERRVHQDRVDGLVYLAHIADAKLRLHPRLRSVCFRDRNRDRIGIDAEDAPRAEEARREPEHTIPATEVEDRASVDVASPVGDVGNLRRDARRRRVLFARGLRLRQGGEGLERALELDLLHPSDRHRPIPRPSPWELGSR